MILQVGRGKEEPEDSQSNRAGAAYQTTGQLAKLIEQAVPRTGKIHPATQTFMALRIAVNQEMEELDALLESIPRLVKPGGRAVVLTFMSLEDRKVKQSFQAMARDGRARILTRHVVRPAEEEIRGQPAVAQRQAARGRVVVANQRYEHGNMATLANMYHQAVRARL